MITVDVCYLDAKWIEAKHPRGRPENKGEFTKTTSTSSTPKTFDIKEGPVSKDEIKDITAKLRATPKDSEVGGIDPRDRLYFMLSALTFAKDPRTTRQFDKNQIFSPVIRSNGKIGAAGALTKDPETGIATIQYLGSTEKGAGGVALFTMINHARDEGMKKIVLESHGTAINFYKHFGFKLDDPKAKTTPVMSLLLKK